MKFEESFLVEVVPPVLWKVLQDVPVMARCVPGVDDVEVIDDDNFHATLTQAVGPVSASFTVKLTITGRAEDSRLDFQAVGKTARGAASYLRTSGRLALTAEGDGTRVTLTADAALGGVLGTVGQKVLARHSQKMAGQFAAALRTELLGGPGETQPGETQPGRRQPVAAAPAAVVPAPPTAPGPGEAPARGRPRPALRLASSPWGLAAAFAAGWGLGALTRRRTQRGA
jgi:carbon monoxide dehydrogenase subunit G